MSNAFSLALQNESCVITNAKGTKSFEGNGAQYLLHTPSKQVKEGAGIVLKDAIVRHGQYKPFMQAVLSSFVPVLSKKNLEILEARIEGIVDGIREESPGKIPGLYNKLTCLAMCKAIMASYAEKEDPKGVKFVYLDAARAFVSKVESKAVVIENAYTVTV